MGLFTYNVFVWAWAALALLTFFVLLRIDAPYGRHSRRDWGPTVPHKVGWIVMELFSPLAFTYFFLAGNQAKSLVTWTFLVLWLLHYLNRSLIYPLRQPTQGHPMPVVVMGSAIFFNTVNGYLNGHFLGAVGPPYTEEWLADPRFLVGFFLFLTGFGINWNADQVLLRLRARGGGGYAIPQGGLYRYISCPNYFGEIIEWLGFAVMTWSFPALTFAAWTAANLIPRALSHHKWYRGKFEDYPKDRRAVVPFVL